MMKSIKIKSLFIAVATFSGIMLFGTNLQAQTPTLSDAEIASVAVTANKIDIGYAKIALNKSKNEAVLGLAKTMLKDHTAIIKSAVELVTKLAVTPKNNDVSKSLMKQAEETKKILQSKSGEAFNKAYVDNEVAYHKAVINAIEKVLIPQSKNEELKSLLKSAIPLLNSHLKHAEMLQKELN